jgi:hypothetical protein
MHNKYLGPPGRSSRPGRTHVSVMESGETGAYRASSAMKGGRLKAPVWMPGV